MNEITFSSNTGKFVLSYSRDEKDYYVSIEVKSSGFKGHADGHVLGEDFEGFLKEIKTLEKYRKGKATLNSAMPDEFFISIESIDNVGHMGITGDLYFSQQGENKRLEQNYKFNLEFEPSQLEKALNQSFQPTATRPAEFNRYG